MRLAIAWVLGIISAAVFGAVLDALAGHYDIHLFETTIAGANTDMAAAVLAILFGAWIGCGVFKASWRRDPSNSERIFCEAIALFAIVQGIGGIIVMLIFNPKPGLYALSVNTLHLAVAGGAFIVARKYYKRHEAGFKKEQH